LGFQKHSYPRVERWPGMYLGFGYEIRREKPTETKPGGGKNKGRKKTRSNRGPKKKSAFPGGGPLKQEETVKGWEVEHDNAQTGGGWGISSMKPWGGVC